MQKKLEASKERYENAANKFASVSHRTEVSQFTKVPSLVSFLSFYAHDVWSGKTRLQSPSIITRSCISAHFRRWWKSIKTRFASPPSPSKSSLLIGLNLFLCVSIATECARILLFFSSLVDGILPRRADADGGFGTRPCLLIFNNVSILLLFS